MTGEEIVIMYQEAALAVRLVSRSKVRVPKSDALEQISGEGK